MKPEDIHIQRVPYAGTPSDDTLFVADARRALAHPERVWQEIADLRDHSVVLYEHYATHGKILRSRSLALTGHGSMISLRQAVRHGKSLRRSISAVCS